MSDLPSMWRTELWHPFVVHIPIALLLFASIIYLLQATPWGKKQGLALVFSGRLLLFPGVVFSWVAVYTGNLADTEVARSLCDPTVAERHEQMALASSILYTIIAGVELVMIYIRQLHHFKRYVAFLVAALALAGSITMAYTGHLGARLVYQQGAAVHQPSEDCEEFE